MSQPVVLEWVIGSLAVLFAVGRLYLWLRDQYLPRRRADVVIQPTVITHPAVTFFAAESSQPGSTTTPSAAGGPAGPNTPSLSDQLRRGWADWPAVLWDW